MDTTLVTPERRLWFGLILLLLLAVHAQAIESIYPAFKDGYVSRSQSSISNSKGLLVSKDDTLENITWMSFYLPEMAKSQLVHVNLSFFLKYLNNPGDVKIYPLYQLNSLEGATDFLAISNDIPNQSLTFSIPNGQEQLIRIPLSLEWIDLDSGVFSIAIFSEKGFAGEISAF